MDYKKVERFKRMYPEGVRVIVNHMDDAYGVPSGTCGTVSHVDDIGNIHVDWDNGSRLALIPEVDSFRIVR